MKGFSLAESAREAGGEGEYTIYLPILSVSLHVDFLALFILVSLAFYLPVILFHHFLTRSLLLSPFFSCRDFKSWVSTSTLKTYHSLITNSFTGMQRLGYIRGL